MRMARLVKLAKKGDKEALLQLISEQQDEYYRLALSYMGNSHDAMDAMEEMIVSLYRHIPKLKKNESFYSWSKTILVNQCRQMLRKADRLLLLESFESEEFHSEDVLLERTEQSIDIQQMLAVVNEQQRETIELKYFHDLDYKTIADITKVSVGTAKSRVFNGLNKIREAARGEFDD
ncbi:MULTISPECIES: RNA polymerase sigma factor [unclassified Sporosarcina]|uniref:RNA polymerase sigma factor n=1 Tax=unclassified Sporosarcina TaxID=2647733 RepID=UPI002040F31C|nr:MULTISPECIES: RNA polymerase sigma factor [unclassified Sporosarcina]GKV64063.1 hypothetical protein NCCP2331_02160 [Sporosarcina sp. NCCP-2331]GLB56362.1 hypothetical protein NCCP2378_21490 [Sporosarcina sp. NCCP-2378]